MNRKEALKHWRNHIEDLIINGRLGEWKLREMMIILDAIIDPKDQDISKSAENKIYQNQDEKNDSSQKVNENYDISGKPIDRTNPLNIDSKSVDDGWKPWPPKDWGEIKEGIFQTTDCLKKPFIPWNGEKIYTNIFLEYSTPVDRIKFWRQI